MAAADALDGHLVQGHVDGVVRSDRLNRKGIGMTTEDRLGKLERTCRRHRRINFALAAVVLLIVGVGAVQGREGGKLVLDELVIRDGEGRKQIWLGSFPDGRAGIQHYDANGKVRIPPPPRGPDAAPPGIKFPISCFHVIFVAALFFVCHPQVGLGEEPVPPYFNYERRLFLIEGSYNIQPTPPVVVGNTRQLLLDKLVVDDAWGCRRTVHQPVKYPDNPVIRSESNMIGPIVQGTVRYDPERPGFRLWSRHWYLDRPKHELGLAQVYYESEDGIHWTAPDLQLVDFNGSNANNLLRGDIGTIWGDPSVMRAPPRLQSRGKYVMLYGCVRREIGPDEYHGVDDRIAWSNDGIHWKDQKENPVFHGRNDCFGNMVYNAERDVFMMYRRASINANQIRRMAYSESKDLIIWTQPIGLLRPDELDPPMMYGMPVTRYQDMYIGLLQMYYGPPLDPALPKEVSEHKQSHMECQLAWSRDGIRWERHPQRPIFLENGPPGSYDSGMIATWQGLPELNNEIYIYYRGDEAIHNREELEKNSSNQLCLAKLRKDGFVSLDAPTQGYMLTRPLLCPGGKLHINAKTQPGGFIRVAVRRGDGERDGTWIEGWTYDEGEKFIFSGDSTDATLRWEANQNFDSLKAQSIRLHFWMMEAELYSFWFE